MEVIYTNGIPQCPYCKKPTKRSGGGGTRTLMNFTPIYDENGVNTNPDRNITTEAYLCHNCNNHFIVKGNSVDGFRYQLETDKPEKKAGQILPKRL